MCISCRTFDKFQCVHAYMYILMHVCTYIMYSYEFTHVYSYHLDIIVLYCSVHNTVGLIKTSNLTMQWHLEMHTYVHICVADLDRMPLT